VLISWRFSFDRKIMNRPNRNRIPCISGTNNITFCSNKISNNHLGSNIVFLVHISSIEVQPDYKARSTRYINQLDKEMSLPHRPQVEKCTCNSPQDEFVREVLLFEWPLRLWQMLLTIFCMATCRSSNGLHGLGAGGDYRLQKWTIGSFWIRFPIFAQQLLHFFSRHHNWNWHRGRNISSITLLRWNKSQYTEVTTIYA